MSVYTLLNQNQIADLLALYRIKTLESFSEISDGIENSNYLIKADHKEFVLTIFERDASANLTPYLSFMAEAQAQGFAVPCPLLNTSDDRLSFFDFEGKKKNFIVCERLPGTHPKHISVALCQHLGEQLAGLHSLKLSSETMAIFPKQNLLDFILPLDFKSLLNKEKQNFYHEEKEFITQLNQQAEGLPTGIGHCDFFPDNSLTIMNNGKEEISAFLDWYDAKNTFLILDLAIIAISWCTEDFRLLKDKEQALLNAYQAQRPFTQEEKQLWNSFLRAGAFFFWISREDYHAQMHLHGRAEAINPEKSTDEFYRLIECLRTRF